MLCRAPGCGEAGADGDGEFAFRRICFRPLGAGTALGGGRAGEALADLPARMLSAGQKRRLALSRLVLSAAPLWLLDEPTLGLDTAAIQRFGGLLAEHRAAGGMVVAATMCLCRCRTRPGAAVVMRVFRAVLARDLRLSVRHGADTLAALLFFVATASLFPLAIGPGPETLGRIAPGKNWVCALLAALLPLDRLFGRIWRTGRWIC